MTIALNPVRKVYCSLFVQNWIQSVIIKNGDTRLEFFHLFLCQDILLSIKNHSIRHPKVREGETCSRAPIFFLYICMVMAALLPAVMLAPAP